jgi:integrase
VAQLNKLTTRGVEAIRKDGVYADGGGLYVRVRGTAKHFLFIYTRDGRRREMGLGAPPAVGLKKARERAQAARDLLADGLDPIAHKSAMTARPTFGVLADEWVEGRKQAVRNVKSVDRWNRTLGLEGYAKALRSIRVDRITTEDVLEVLKPIWAKGPTATLARGYIEAVLDAAKAKGHRTGENPARWRGHLDHLLPRPQKLQRGHHAALPYRDIPKVMGALRSRTSVAARLAEFTILTAARSGEALGATWSEIDPEAKTWSVPAARMKAARIHTVPLSDRALAILRELEPEGGISVGLIFAESERQLSNMAVPMLLRRMGLEITLHGFRSSFRDWAGDRTTFPREIAEAALAHYAGGVEAAYRRGDALDKRRKLMDAWAKYCGS